jgi:hypothetical protein
MVSAALLPEEHRATQLVSGLLSALDVEAQCDQRWPQVPRDRIGEGLDDSYNPCAGLGPGRG